MFWFSILIFYHYVPHSNRCGAFCFLIKPSFFKAFSCFRKKGPPLGGQVKRLPHFIQMRQPLKFFIVYLTYTSSPDLQQIQPPFIFIQFPFTPRHFIFEPGLSTA